MAKKFALDKFLLLIHFKTFFKWISNKNLSKEVRFGQIFVTYPLEESLEEDSLTVGDEAAKLSLDYDSIGDLPDKLPVDVELNINLRGKVLSVELL